MSMQDYIDDNYEKQIALLEREVEAGRRLHYEIQKACKNHALRADELGRENLYLKEILFCCGEKAVVNWNDFTVGLVDRTLKGFTITKERYMEILEEGDKQSNPS